MHHSHNHNHSRNRTNRFTADHAKRSTTMTTTIARHRDDDEDTALARAWTALEAVPDPEIPVVSIRELGILRDVRRASDGVVEVVITPTYSGCPAMWQIAEDIGNALDAAHLT